MIGQTRQSVEREPTAARRFRVYNVGIAKTGTTSIAGIFGRYRSAHEFWFEETVKQVSAWHRGTLSAADLRQYVLRRDREGGLEVDSATFNHHFLPLLIEEFPDSKFIFSIRDCFSWFDSIVTMGLKAGTAVPAWMMEYGHFIARETVDHGSIAAPFDIVRVLPDLVDGLFRYWSEMNTKVLDLLPAGRALIVRTHEISISLDRLALFVGVPRDSLVAVARHSNRAAEKLEILESLDADLVAERYEAHCRKLMERLFPELGFTPGQLGSGDASDERRSAR